MKSILILALCIVAANAACSNIDLHQYLLDNRNTNDSIIVSATIQENSGTWQHILDMYFMDAPVATNLAIRNYHDTTGGEILVDDATHLEEGAIGGPTYFYQMNYTFDNDYMLDNDLCTQDSVTSEAWTWTCNFVIKFWDDCINNSVEHWEISYTFTEQRFVQGNATLLANPYINTYGCDNCGTINYNGVVTVYTTDSFSALKTDDYIYLDRLYARLATAETTNHEVEIESVKQFANGQGIELFGAGLLEDDGSLTTTADSYVGYADVTTRVVVATSFTLQLQGRLNEVRRRLADDESSDPSGSVEATISISLGTASDSEDSEEDSNDEMDPMVVGLAAALGVAIIGAVSFACYKKKVSANRKEAVPQSETPAPKKEITAEGSEESAPVNRV